MVSGTPSPYCYSYIDLKPVCLNKAAACSSRIVFILLALVAPASALFIQSLPEERRESAKKYVRVATVISIYVTIIGFMHLIDTFLLVDHPLVSTMLLMFEIYVTLGLPSIGVCLVLLAKDNRNGSDSSISLFGKL